MAEEVHKARDSFPMVGFRLLILRLPAAGAQGVRRHASHISHLLRQRQLQRKKNILFFIYRSRKKSVEAALWFAEA